MVVSARQLEGACAPGVSRADEGLDLELLLVVATLAAVTVGQGGFYRRVSDVGGGFLAVAAAVLVGRRRPARGTPPCPPAGLRGA